MKKAYVKPQVYFEDFQLSASIAAGCGSPSTVHAKDICAIDFPGVGKIFFDSIAACEEHVEDGYGSICYHNPEPTNNLFNSL